MIFVTVGTAKDPFDRLIKAVEQLETDEEIVIQAGSSRRPASGRRTVSFIPFDELLMHVAAARIVVCHAGVGSVLAALTSKKKPLVVPRLRAYREAVDDHQLYFARSMADRNLVTLLEDPAGLADALSRHQATSITDFAQSELAHELGEFLRAQRLRSR